MATDSSRLGCRFLQVLSASFAICKALGYNDSAIDEPLKSESKGDETPDTDKIA